MVWYWDQREYILWIMAVTLPKTKACINAAGEKKEEKEEKERGRKLDRTLIMEHTASMDDIY